MNPEIRKLWVEKLRDPETKQGRGHLKDEVGGLCCLGVLTELWRQSEDNTEGFDWIGNASCQPLNPCAMGSGYLRQQVIEWAGLRSNNPILHLSKSEGSNSLAGLNDNGCTFLQIADLIEKHL
jgi:hypothetical protein